MTKEEGDSELRAIEAMIAALAPLDAEARERAVDYVFKRLQISPGRSYESPVLPRSEPSDAGKEPASTAAAAPVAQDIRSLRDQKQPRSATEMAAIVAYYLAELAPQGERKEAIATADIEKYFKQAGHRLPTAPQYTLSNAAAAGYFENAGRGLYKLNPVGHNLVAHNLPSDRGRREQSSPKAPSRKRGGAATGKSRKSAGKSGRSSSRGSGKRKRP